MMSSPRRVLVVEDRRSMREMLAQTLALEGYEVATAADTGTARRHLKEQGPDLVLTDLRLPDGSGLTVLEESRRSCPSAPVIMMTAYGSVDVAVEAMRRGATDFICKPFDTTELVVRVGQLLAEASSAAEPALGRLDRVSVVAVSAAMRAILAKAQRAAHAAVPVLLTGESGTGKEVVARFIHAAGPRANSPFVAVNCAALPAQLVESELFGHVRGAFTGADGDRVGLIREADGGTLFLDELTEMEAGLQGKLLRVLQDSRVTPVGSAQPESVDVRYIAATNRDIEGAIAAGTLREDLFYRLAVAVFRLPPLRERSEDILPLADHFLSAAMSGRPAVRFSEGARQCLLRHLWPGNIRELRNCVERAVLFTDGEIVEADVLELGAAPGSAAGRTAHPSDASLVAAGQRAARETERALLLATLDDVGWNKREAAHRLGISYKTLFNKLRDLDIPKQPARQAS
jgi:DNA-binding NtrC family response regulator